MDDHITPSVTCQGNPAKPLGRSSAGVRPLGSPAGAAPGPLLGHRDIALGLEAHAPLWLRVEC